MTRFFQRVHVAAGLTVLLLMLSGCGGQHYSRIEAGELKGDLIVEWRNPDSFIYIPAPDNPLRFIRSENGHVIQPQRMWTDGGSIPRAFWVFRNYSPWGYGPAFIVHDWLFRMQQCELDGYTDYDIKLAAVIMSEVMKTLMEQPDFDYGSKQSVYLMYKAVRSSPARESWESRDCQSVEVERQVAPDQVFRLSFD